MPHTPRTRQTRDAKTLNNSLVLNGFILHQFGVKSLEDLSKYLKDPAYEGYDSNGVSYFAEQLKVRFCINDKITEDMLLEYDHNIFQHTQTINHNRDKAVTWKYFQYLSLLFTELYLDRYFSNKEVLLNDIRTYHTTVYNNDPQTNHEIEEFTEKDLNKLAFWSATGSGKTLMMHVNILQFQHYLKKYGKKVNRTILVTPNEGLTNQHIEEFAQSSLDAHIFDKSASFGLFGKQGVDVIEITKLSDADGDKTVAVESFEKNNLVLIDEGHRGSSGDKWKLYRDQLSKDGFAFEYSATFGQAINSVSSPTKRKEMLAEYAKATLFDYSYRYFYNDGYGKDYQILNMTQTWDTNNLHTYLTACMLNFYEQLRLFIDSGTELNPFLLERPLAIFVGSSVIADSGTAAWDRNASDVVNILMFIQRFVRESAESVRNIKNLIEGTDGLVNQYNHSIFERSFKYLRSMKSIEPEQIYYDILATVFHSKTSDAVLHLDNLRGVDGEIGMRVGNGDYFGVINVGNASKLIEKCYAAGIRTMSKDYTDKSLFETINKPNSNINILIGSKKFTEGWSSWRVSTMGLMNVGRSEGSQIIQLFGRGVRLKGYKMSLKRSSALDTSLQPDYFPKNIQTLETLNIFGVKADYMDQFREILNDMGLPSNDSDYEEVELPVLPVVDLGKKKLKYLKVKDGLDFKKEQFVTITVGMLDRVPPVTLDYYAKIDAMGSFGSERQSRGVVNTAKFTSAHLSVIDWTKLYFELIDFKNDKAWYNLNISLSALKEVMTTSSSWYELTIPAPAMEFGNYRICVELWQNIVTALMKGYVEKAYNIAKSKWMSEHVEIAYLDSFHPNFESEYQLLIHKDLKDFYDKILQIKDELENNTFLKTVQIGAGHNFDALHISGHLYQPLLYINGKDSTFKGTNGDSLIEIRPVPLNLGERDFLVDIQEFADSVIGKAFMQDKELYLLRNKSRKGIGFFDASGFYPDFILWLIVGKHQYVSFVDPKGILHLKAFTDSKIALHKNIKEIEHSLGDKDITLNSYIIANTDLREVRHWIQFRNQALLDNEILQKFNNHNIYFPKYQKELYLKNMFDSMMTKKE